MEDTSSILTKCQEDDSGFVKPHSSQNEGLAELQFCCSKKSYRVVLFSNMFFPMLCHPSSSLNTFQTFMIVLGDDLWKRKILALLTTNFMMLAPFLIAFYKGKNPKDFMLNLLFQMQ